MNYDDTDEKDHVLSDSVLLDVAGEEGVSDDEDPEDGSALLEEDEKEEW